MATDIFKYGSRTPFISIEHGRTLSDAFADENEAVIASVCELDDMGKLRYLHVTDTHVGSLLGDDHAMLFTSMVYVARKIAADFILITGDVITGATGDASVQQSVLHEIAEIFDGCDIPVIISRGNHDDNSVAGLTEDNVVTNRFWNAYMAKAFTSKSAEFVFPADDNGYFYCDIQAKKIRIVNINSSDLTDEERLSTGGQNYQIVSQAQLTWLSDVAFAVEDGWKIICACHVTAVDGMAHNLGIENDTELYEVLSTHAAKIIAYNCGHGHMSTNYLDPTTGIYFIMGNTCGGSTIAATSAPAGYGYSSVSADAKAAYPTGAMLFDVCIVKQDNTVDKIRWGAKDDVFRDSES